MKYTRVLAILCHVAALLFTAAAHASVDVNSASALELESISGIGPATSDRIVQERRKGPFRDGADLIRRVRGIGERKLNRMIDSGLVIGGNGGVSLIAGRPINLEMNNRVPVIAGQMGSCQRAGKRTRPSL